nr:putative serine/threonine-protein kinase-like protein CCR3 [Coffea arabica]XP_027069929.1 putative serine/threonine-protein kinase-like protein CCR3 [Coffea arabica]
MASRIGGGEGEVFEVTQQDLELFTDNFSQNNHIAKAQYCELYHGRIPQGWKGFEARDVTVKVWVKAAEMSHKYRVEALYQDLLENFNYEITFLKHHNSTTSNLPVLMAFCRVDEKEMLGVIYDLKSMNTLRDFVDKGEFKWLDRIQVAVRLARLLELLHGYQPRYLVRDLSAAHIMLDQDLNPVLFNFFMLTGGVIGEKKDDTPFQQNRTLFGSYGYIDFAYVMTGVWCEATDIFALGVILLELLFKLTVDHHIDEKTGAWIYLHLDAVNLYPLKKSRFSLKERKCSFADKSFEEEPEFNLRDGQKISKLARLCVDGDLRIRPSTKNVVGKLQELQKVKFKK